MVDILKLTDIEVKRNGKRILKGISLSIEKGMIHALLGPNGSGKSTLAFAIMGVYELSKGNVYFEGKDISRKPIHERARLGITMAWQNPATFEGLTVKEYLSIGGNANVEEALRMVNLDPARYLDRVMDSSLSGGERKVASW